MKLDGDTQDLVSALVKDLGCSHGEVVGLAVRNLAAVVMLHGSEGVMEMVRVRRTLVDRPPRPAPVSSGTDPLTHNPFEGLGEGAGGGA